MNIYMDKMSLCSISPIDGRYKSYTYGLNNLFSEYAFIRQRIIIEIKCNIKVYLLGMERIFMGI